MWFKVGDKVRYKSGGMSSSMSTNKLYEVIACGGEYWCWADARASGVQCCVFWYVYV